MKKRHVAIRVVMTIIALTLMGPIVASAQQPPDSSAAFERLKTLVGTWDAIDKTKPAQPMVVTYSLTGSGSVLMEELKSQGSASGGMSTAYHLDQGRLVLTHFCGAANQPRMRVKAIDDNGRKLRFEIYDITNHADPQAYHSTSLEVSFLTDQRVELAYGGTSRGRQSTQVFQLTRKPR